VHSAFCLFWCRRYQQSTGACKLTTTQQNLCSSRNGRGLIRPAVEMKINLLRATTSNFLGSDRVPSRLQGRNRGKHWTDGSLLLLPPLLNAYDPAVELMLPHIGRNNNSFLNISADFLVALISKWNLFTLESPSPLGTEKPQSFHRTSEKSLLFVCPPEGGLSSSRIKQTCSPMVLVLI